MKNIKRALFVLAGIAMFGCSTVPERSVSFVASAPAGRVSDGIFAHAGSCLAKAETGLSDGTKVERFDAYGVSVIEVWSYASDGVSGPHLRMEVRDLGNGTHILVQQPEGHGALSSSYSEQDNALWDIAQLWAQGEMVCRNEQID